MQRMSDMLTRWLDGNLRRQGEEGREQESSEAPEGNSENQASGGQAEGGGHEQGSDEVNEPTSAVDGKTHSDIKNILHSVYDA